MADNNDDFDCLTMGPTSDSFMQVSLDQVHETDTSGVFSALVTLTVFGNVLILLAS